jgi:ribosomal-protein-alanine N-acetyltransferase
MWRSPSCLRGKEILLRPPTTEDFGEFTRLMKISERAYRGRIHPFKGKQQFEEYIAKSSNEEYFRFLICRSMDGRIVGTVSLFMICRKSFRNAVVGYMVGVPYARLGYGTEALKLIVRFAFGPLKLHRLEANIQPDNAASLALVRRVGFQREGYSPRFLKIGGRWRDHERWAILADGGHKQ